MTLEISGLRKSLNGELVLDAVALRAGSESVHAIVTDPGNDAGKVLLACLCGHFPTPTGTLRWGDEDFGAQPEFARPVTFFGSQERLNGNKSTVNALREALKQAGVPAKERPRRAREALEQASQIASHWPQPLQSALALALATQAAVWAVEATAPELAPWFSEIRALARQFQRTVLALLEPARALAEADEITLLHGNRSLRQGEPLELYRRPDSLAEARLLGPVNEVAGTVTALGAGEAIVHTLLGEFRGALSEAAEALAEGAKAQVLTRPEAWHLDRYPPEENCLPVRILASSYHGATATHRAAIYAPGLDEEDELPEPLGQLDINEINPARSSIAASEEFYAWIAPEDVVVTKT